MKKKLKNKHLSQQIFLVLGMVFLLLSLAQILITNIVKQYYFNSQKKQFTALASELTTESDFKQFITLYNEGYYVFDLKNESNFSLTEITINSVSYRSLLTSSLSVGDEIHYTLVDSNIIQIGQEGTLKGIVEQIVYPQNINYLVGNLPYLSKAQDLAKNTHKIITFSYQDKTIYCQTVQGAYLIFMPVIAQNYAFTAINIFQSVLLLVIMLVFIIIGYYTNHIFVNPILEMIDISDEILKGKYSHNDLTYSNWSYRDLGERITKLGESLHDTAKELDNKTTEVNNYMKRSEEDYKFNKQLVANISHEIKTPLAIIQATICGIQDGIFEGEEINQELNNILNEIEITNAMLQEIVGLYKIESSTFQLDLVSINLDELLKAKMHEFEKIAAKYEQKLMYNGLDNLTIHADKIQIERVINNIILNAITYSPPGNSVSIETRRTNRYSVLEVINTGVTIDNNELKKLFEPFYRLDRARNKSEDHGNGLGLYFVKQMLDKHQFDFGMENTIDGVRFYIIFD